jgi:GAF domain-containing protein
VLEAPIPEEEQARLKELHSYGVLDTSPEEVFDDITHLVQDIAGTKIGIISLVDENRQWFKSCVGLDDAPKETPRNISFCGHTIAQRKALIINDALQDERFYDNPLVKAPPKIRFYAGAPLISSSGQRLGTLCVIDRQPHLLTPYQEELLVQLSAMAMHEINHLHQARLCSLTAVLTRQALLSEGEAWLQRARAEGTTPVLITVALGGLRQLNAEANGARQVDERLQHIAAICAAQTGTQGVVAAAAAMNSA